MQLPVPLLLAAQLLHSVYADPKVVSFKTRRKPLPALGLGRRALPTESLWNRRQMNLYEIDIQVGTPPQNFALDIDTGSSDIWLFDAAEQCGQLLCPGNAFEPAMSSTYTPAGDLGVFSISYVDGAAVNGTYFHDQLSLGNVTIDNATLALGTELVSWHSSPSIMGIGFEHLEAGSDTTLYPGLTRLMVEQGIINTRSYSLWLDDLDASTGTLLFGGYDTSKFLNNLTVLPIQTPPGGVMNQMLVDWSGLTFNNGSTSVSLTESAFPMQALLDSGTTFMLVPEALYTQATQLFNTYSESPYSNATLVDCDQANGTLDFSFGGGSTPLISVPFSEIAPQAYNTNGRPVTNEDGTLACEFGIGQSANGQIILGDTFLRSAYVVYELDSGQIAMAQSNVNADPDDSNIVEIQAGSDPFVGAAKSAAGRSKASSSWTIYLAALAVLVTVSLLS